MIELVEVEPGKFRVKRPALKPARSDLPLPYVISDIMPPTELGEQAKGLGKAHGLIEIGTEKLKPKQRAFDHEGRRRSIKKAIEQYKSR